MKNWVSVKRSEVLDAKLWRATQWAKKHCPTYITNDYGIIGGRVDAMSKGDDPTSVDFFFGTSEHGRKDMVLFALRWL